MIALAVTFDDIVAAQQRLGPVTRATPVLTSRTADRRAGSGVFFKCENFQRVGAFKFRGAYNALSQLSPPQRQRGVAAYSSGNHAQAVALAASLLDVKATILMPLDAPANKLAATRGYGAEIILYDRYTENREALGTQLAQERGLTLVPSYDHPHVIAGQGTVAKELMERTPELDTLVVPLGGGGLLSGCAIAVRTFNPRCRVIGVAPQASGHAQSSLRAGSLQRVTVPQTIADGAQTQSLGQLTFPILQRCVDDVISVSDDELVETMAFFASRMKMVAEPTGCLAAAAVLNRKISGASRRTGVVISGGNIDLSRFASLIQPSRVQ